MLFESLWFDKSESDDSHSFKYPKISFKNCLAVKIQLIEQTIQSIEFDR